MLNKLSLAIALLILTTSQVNAASIEEYFEQPICYLASEDSDIPDGNGGVQQNQIFVQLSFVKFTPSIIGVLNFMPAGVDSARGVLETFEILPLENAPEEYLLKSYHHVSVEGYNAINEQYFKVSADNISIGFGARTEGYAPDLYIYENPSDLDYARTLPRVEC